METSFVVSGTATVCASQPTKLAPNLLVMISIIVDLFCIRERERQSLICSNTKIQNYDEKTVAPLEAIKVDIAQIKVWLYQAEASEVVVLVAGDDMQRV